MVKTAFLKLFLEAKKKCLTPYGVSFPTEAPYTKVSWLGGYFFIGLPI
jgi:hypothetical protein